MTVSDQIIQVLDALCEKFGIVIDWTSANVMPYLTTLFTKLVTWEIWTSVAWMGIAAAVCIAWVVFLIACRKPIKNAIIEADPLGFLAILGSIVVFGVTVGIIGTQIFDIIKCVTFPEMFVFEYVKELLSSGG